MEMLTRAAALMAIAHAGDWTDHKPPLPYMVHPCEVVLNLRSIGEIEDEALLAVGFLHDVVEHGGVTLDQIKAGFGDEVARLVGEVTRTEPDSAATAGLTKDEIWQMRSELLLADIRRMSPEAMTVKLADRLSNLRIAAATKSGRKLARYHEQTRTMLGIIPKSTNPGLWRAVDRLLTS